MDINLNNIGVRNTGYAPEELEAIALSDEIIGSGIASSISVSTGNSLGVDTKQSVPIYELKADEEARAKLKTHQEDADYEELVKRVNTHEPYFADKDEMDHRAIAVILDNDILFDELLRAIIALDDTHSEIMKETNKSERHAEMINELRADMHYMVDNINNVHEMIEKLM